MLTKEEEKERKLKAAEEQEKYKGFSKGEKHLYREVADLKERDRLVEEEEKAKTLAVSANVTLTIDFTVFQPEVELYRHPCAHQEA